MMYVGVCTHVLFLPQDAACTSFNKAMIATVDTKNPKPNPIYGLIA